MVAEVVLEKLPMTYLVLSGCTVAVMVPLVSTFSSSSNSTANSTVPVVGTLTVSARVPEFKSLIKSPT